MFVGSSENGSILTFIEMLKTFKPSQIGLKSIWFGSVLIRLDLDIYMNIFNT